MSASPRDSRAVPIPARAQDAAPRSIPASGSFNMSFLDNLAAAGAVGSFRGREHSVLENRPSLGRRPSLDQGSNDGDSFSRTESTATEVKPTNLPHPLLLLCWTCVLPLQRPVSSCRRYAADPLHRGHGPIQQRRSGTTSTGSTSRRRCSANQRFCTVTARQACSQFRELCLVLSSNCRGRPRGVPGTLHTSDSSILETRSHPPPRIS